MRALDLRSLYHARVDNRIVFFFEGTFQSGTVRLWTGAGDFSWDSKTWNGNGYLRSIAPGAEADDVSSPTCDIVLSSVSSEILSLVLSPKQGATGTVWLGYLSEAGALVGTPIQLFQGKLDVPVIREEDQQSEVTLTYETHLVDFDRKREYRYTQETQKLFYPTDLGFQYVIAADKWDGFWGNKRRKNRRRRQRTQRKGTR